MRGPQKQTKLALGKILSAVYLFETGQCPLPTEGHQRLSDFDAAFSV
jgi:hypothetical protein